MPTTKAKAQTKGNQAKSRKPKPNNAVRKKPAQANCVPLLAVISSSLTSQDPSTPNSVVVHRLDEFHQVGVRWQSPDYTTIYPQNPSTHGVDYTHVEVVHRGSTRQIGATFGVALIDLDPADQLLARVPTTSLIATTWKADSVTWAQLAHCSRSRKGPFKFTESRSILLPLDVSNNSARELRGLVVVLYSFGVGIAAELAHTIETRLYHKPIRSL